MQPVDGLSKPCSLNRPDADADSNAMRAEETRATMHMCCTNNDIEVIFLIYHNFLVGTSKLAQAMAYSLSVSFVFIAS